MTHGRRLRPFAAALLLPGAILLGLGCTPPRDEPDEGPAAATNPAPEVRTGPPGVVLTPEQIAHSGVRSEAPAAARRQGQLHCFGRVLSVEDLAASRQSLARVVADEAAARAQGTAAEAEAERLEGLYRNGANVSLKDAQAARALAAQGRAQVDAATAAVAAERARVRQAWGARLATALENGDEPAASLLSLEEVPLLVTCRSDDASTAPGHAVVLGPDGPCDGRFLATVPRTDGAIQGIGWLYAVRPGPTGLPAGLNLETLLPVGAERNGVEVPRGAGLWWQGTLWAYVARDSGRFERVLLPTPEPTRKGWFVTAGLAPGDRVVVTGAQVLLSEELKAAGVTGEVD